MTSLKKNTEEAKEGEEKGENVATELTRASPNQTVKEIMQ
jgi:hypothetical protein